LHVAILMSIVAPYFFGSQPYFEWFADDGLPSVFTATA
jgi:hypothetical protein